MAHHNNFSTIILSILFLPQLLFGMRYTQDTLFPYLASLPDTPNKITVHSELINLLKPSTSPSAKDWHFGNINHLNLIVNGPLTLYHALTALTISLTVNGDLTLDKGGTIAATHGSLYASAHRMNILDGKLYGFGPTYIESTQGDIILGDSVWGIDEDIKQQYINTYTYPHYSRSAFNSPRFTLREKHQEKISLQHCFFSLKQSNGAYVASDNTLTLQSAKDILLQHGTVASVITNHMIARNKIKNLAGKISCQGAITIEATEYDHIREEAIAKPWGDTFRPYPGSAPAIVESLGKITFVVKKLHNLASSIRSGDKICVNESPLHGSPNYIEETQTFRPYGPGIRPEHHDIMVVFRQSCITQAGDTINMNLGNFTITSTMNAGAIAMKGNSGSFINTDAIRTTVNPTQPTVINVTEHIQHEAQKPGLYLQAADGSIQTEFPLGIPSKSKEKYMILLEREGSQQTTHNWKNIFNPLSSINLELFAQRLISQHTGKIYQGDCSMLWKNANKWCKDNRKEIMSENDLQKINQSMLLTQIVSTPTDELQQHTMLCIAPQDVNPYQSPGDIVADTTFSCSTQNDQTYLNNRIVANGPDGITIQSTNGNINLETQSYTVTRDILDGKVVEQYAMPQQQLIAPAGSVSIHADGNITRTGTLVAAATNIEETSDRGSVIKNPLILSKMVETHHTKKGFFSSSHRVETSITHSAVQSETIAGTQLHDRADIAIHAVAPRDAAGQEIIYEAPKTAVESLLIANRTTSSVQKSSTFCNQEHESSKEAPFAVSAHIQAPTVRFLGEDARVNANIYATELHDETEKGIQFVVKVAEMLCSGQTIASSPLASVDSGFEAGYEVMIQPMLMVEKIIRLKDDGCMLFESVIFGKNPIEIIGPFVEATYHLKQWRRDRYDAWQLFPDEALVVVALAITLYTQGMGVELLQPLLNGVIAATGMQLSAAGIAAVNAGVSAICSALQHLC